MDVERVAEAMQKLDKLASAANHDVSGAAAPAAADIDGLREELRTTKNSLDLAVATAQQVFTLVKKIPKLEEELQAAEKERDHYALQIDALKLQVEKESAKTVTLSNMLDDQSLRAEALQLDLEAYQRSSKAEKQRLNRSNSSISDIADTATQENLRAQAQSEELRATAARLRAEIRELKQQLKEAQAARDEAISAVQALQPGHSAGSSEVMQRRLAKVRAMNDTLSQQLDEAQAALVDKEAQASMLPQVQAERDELHRLLTDLRAEIARNDEPAMPPPLDMSTLRTASPIMPVSPRRRSRVSLRGLLDAADDGDAVASPSATSASAHLTPRLGVSRSSSRTSLIMHSTSVARSVSYESYTPFGTAAAAAAPPAGPAAPASPLARAADNSTVFLVKATATPGVTPRDMPAARIAGAIAGYRDFDPAAVSTPAPRISGSVSAHDLLDGRGSISVDALSRTQLVDVVHELRRMVQAMREVGTQLQAAARSDVDSSNDEDTRSQSSVSSGASAELELARDMSASLTRLRQRCDAIRHETQQLSATQQERWHNSAAMLDWSARLCREHIEQHPDADGSRSNSSRLGIDDTRLHLGTAAVTLVVLVQLLSAFWAASKARLDPFTI